MCFGTKHYWNDFNENWQAGSLQPGNGQGIFLSWINLRSREIRDTLNTGEPQVKHPNEMCARPAKNAKILLNE